MKLTTLKNIINEGDVLEQAYHDCQHLCDDVDRVWDMFKFFEKASYFERSTLLTNISQIADQI